jgi:predicted transposase YbfD/YdcC
VPALSSSPTGLASGHLDALSASTLASADAVPAGVLDALAQVPDPVIRAGCGTAWSRSWRWRCAQPWPAPAPIRRSRSGPAMRRRGCGLGWGYPAPSPTWSRRLRAWPRRALPAHRQRQPARPARPAQGTALERRPGRAHPGRPRPRAHRETSPQDRHRHRGPGLPLRREAIQITRKTRKHEWRTETAYAICSLPAAQTQPAQLAAWIRGHWSIENQLHWVRSLQWPWAPSGPTTWR